MVLAVISTPRKMGNSRILLEKFIEPLSGFPIKIFDLYKMRIHPCIACDKCHVTGFCIIEDDIREFYEIENKIEAIVVSSPIYFYGPPAPLKALIDRSQVFWYKKFILREQLKEKKAFIINVAASDTYKTFEAAEKIMKVWINSLNGSITGYKKIGGLEEEGEVLKKPHILEEVKIEGKRFRSHLAHKDS